jgi:hypothetical protein
MYQGEDEHLQNERYPRSIMEDRMYYPRWHDDTCALVAKYSGQCDYCDRKIKSGRSMIAKRHGAWLHLACATRVDREDSTRSYEDSLVT